MEKSELADVNRKILRTETSLEEAEKNNEPEQALEIRRTLNLLLAKKARLAAPSTTGFLNFGCRSGLSHIFPQFNLWCFFSLLFVLMASYFIMSLYGKKKSKNENFFTKVKILHGLCFISLSIWLIIEHSDDSFTDLRLLSILACWTNAFVLWIRSYKWISVMEFIVIGICGYWLNLQFLTFPFYSIAKLLSSFIIFLVEFVLFIPLERPVPLRLLLFFVNAPCESKIEVEGTKLHYTSRDSKLIATKNESMAPAVFNTCVGLELKNNFMQVKETLNGIGKCHDWSVVAISILATHKYMTYSFMMYQRQSSWFILGFNIFYLLVGMGPFMTDFLFLIWSGVDIFNCKDDGLQEDYMKMRETLHLPFSLIVLRWVILASIIVALAIILQHHSFLSKYGFILFLIVGLVCHMFFQLIMKLWQPNNNTFNTAKGTIIRHKKRK